MKDATAIHPLARPNVKSGQIKFIHTDGTERVLSSVVNDLTGDRMTAFGNDPPTLNHNLTEVRALFRSVRQKAREVTEVIGDF